VYGKWPQSLSVWIVSELVYGGLKTPFDFEFTGGQRRSSYRKPVIIRFGCQPLRSSGLA